MLSQSLSASTPCCPGLSRNLLPLAVRSITTSRLCAPHRVPIVVLLFVALLFGVGCSRKKTKATVPVSTRPPLASVVGASETGVASWYGHPYHGRRTANGEVYDQDEMTAAHPSLAFNSWVRVHNLDNGRQTDVRINDRGPFARGRAIDLSRAAARSIDMIGPGTANVRVVVTRVQDPRTPRASTPQPTTSSETSSSSTAPVSLPPATTTTGTLPETNRTPSSSSAPPSRPSPLPGAGSTSSSHGAAGYSLQFGAFRSRENAGKLRDQVAEFLQDARVVPSPNDPSLFLVLGSSSLTREEAEQLARELDEDFPRVFPVPTH